MATRSAVTGRGGLDETVAGEPAERGAHSGVVIMKRGCELGGGRRSAVHEFNQDVLAQRPACLGLTVVFGLDASGVLEGYEHLDERLLADVLVVGHGVVGVDEPREGHAQ